MSFTLAFLLFATTLTPYFYSSSTSFDLKISMDAVKIEELKDKRPVILKFRVMNISQNRVPENAYKFTILINNQLVSLDRNPNELLPQTSITYTKQLGSYHFIAHKDSSYNISAKIEIAEGYEDSDMRNNKVEKLIVVK